MAKRKAASARSRKTSGARGPGTRSRAAAKKTARAGTRKAKRTAKRSATGRKSAARKSSAGRKTAGRKTAGRKTAHRSTASRKTAARKTTARTSAAARKGARAAGRRSGGEKTVPLRKAPALDRARRTISDEDIVPTPPSSLDMDRSASAARSGGREMRERYGEHTETSPALTGGDVDADWQSAYSVGDEAPGGDNPTPDQDIVDDIGRAVGVEYQDNEELKSEEKIAQRDRNRWELDPASSEDYNDR